MLKQRVQAEECVALSNNQCEFLKILKFISTDSNSSRLGKYNNAKQFSVHISTAKTKLLIIEINLVPLSLQSSFCNEGG